MRPAAGTPLAVPLLPLSHTCQCPLFPQLLIFLHHNLLPWRNAVAVGMMVVSPVSRNLVVNAPGQIRAFRETSYDRGRYTLECTGRVTLVRTRIANSPVWSFENLLSMGSFSDVQFSLPGRGNLVHCSSILLADLPHGRRGILDFRATQQNPVTSISPF